MTLLASPVQCTPIEHLGMFGGLPVTTRAGPPSCRREARHVLAASTVRSTGECPCLQYSACLPSSRTLVEARDYQELSAIAVRRFHSADVCKDRPTGSWTRHKSAGHHRRRHQEVNLPRSVSEPHNVLLLDTALRSISPARSKDRRLRSTGHVVRKDRVFHGEADHKLGERVGGTRGSHAVRDPISCNFVVYSPGLYPQREHGDHVRELHLHSPRPAAQNRQHTKSKLNARKVSRSRRNPTLESRYGWTVGARQIGDTGSGQARTRTAAPPSLGRQTREARSGARRRAAARQAKCGGDFFPSPVREIQRRLAALQALQRKHGLLVGVKKKTTGCSSKETIGGSDVIATAYPVFQDETFPVHSTNVGPQRLLSLISNTATAGPASNQMPSHKSASRVSVIHQEAAVRPRSTALGVQFRPGSQLFSSGKYVVENGTALWSTTPLARIPEEPYWGRPPHQPQLRAYQGITTGASDRVSKNTGVTHSALTLGTAAGRGRERIRRRSLLEKVSTRPRGSPSSGPSCNALGISEMPTDTKNKADRVVMSRRRAAKEAASLVGSARTTYSGTSQPITSGATVFSSSSSGRLVPRSQVACAAASSEKPSSCKLRYLEARKDCNDDTAPYWTVSRGIVNRFGHACRECKKGIAKNDEAIVRDGRKLRFFYHPECFSGDADPRTQAGSSAHDNRFKSVLKDTRAPPSKGKGKWSVQSYGLKTCNSAQSNESFSSLSVLGDGECANNGGGEA